MPDDARWVLADVDLAVGLLGTLRRQGDALAGDDLPHDPEAVAWVARHVDDGGAGDRAALVALREQLRDLFTAIVDDHPPRPGSIEALNDLAAASPVNLAARWADDGSLTIERTGPGDPGTVLRANVARAALALLATPARDRLRLCRAPGCSLFFLTGLRRQQWCSADCGNRARVARHYTRQRHRHDRR